MNRNLILQLGLISAALVSGAAYADQGTVSRESVRAELVAAQQAGDLPVGFAAIPSRVIAGGATEAARTRTTAAPIAMAAANGKTRAEVRAELEAAEQAGDLPVGFAAIPSRVISGGAIGGPAQGVAKANVQ